MMAHVARLTERSAGDIHPVLHESGPLASPYAKGVGPA